MNYRAKATAATRAMPISPPPTLATLLAAAAFDVVVVTPPAVAAPVGVVVAVAVGVVVAAAVAVVLGLHRVPVYVPVGDAGEALYVMQILAQKATPNEVAAGMVLA